MSQEPNKNLEPKKEQKQEDNKEQKNGQEPKNQNSTEKVNVNINEKDISELSFFKKCIISIKDLEKYPYLATEKMTKAIGYIAILLIIVTAITGACFTFRMYEKANKAIKYFESDIPNLSYENGNLLVEQTEPIIIDTRDELAQKVIIDTSSVSDEQYNEYEKQLKNNTTAILFLKDKMLIKVNGRDELVSYSYENLAQLYEITNINKADILSRFTGSNLTILMFGVFIIYFIYIFMQNFIVTLLYAITLAGAGYITALILRLRLRFDAMIKIAMHSLTLSTILLAIYTVINIFTGFVMSYFDVMYIAVAYIYIIATLFIIKSELVKKQMELSKILEEQSKIALERQAEEERKERERLEREEKERRKKRDEERKNKKGKSEDGEGKKNNDSGTPAPEAGFQSIENKTN